MAPEEIDPRPHKYWPSVESLKAYGQKNLQATLLFVDFTKAFDSIHREKMEQILLAYGLPKETVAAITILYRNTKVKVRSPAGDTEYFDIVAGVLQGDTLAPYLFIICIDYVLRSGQQSIGYRSYGNQTWPIKWNAVSSRQRSYRYYCMDALLGR